MEGLLSLPGVGRKTANLVLILAYESRKNICVDTHVHRIANRLGWVTTKTPDETEQALYRATEPQWWPYINLYLVTWGPECMPAGVSALSGVRHQGSLPAGRRDGRQQDDAGQLSVGAGLTCALASPDCLVLLGRPGVTPPSASFFQARDPPQIAVPAPPFWGEAQ
jgi:hypothetical protein